MKKVKFFASILRERDWLEEMATQGWLLQNMTLGIIYDFKAIDPCEKVYEIERFALSRNPAISELTARSNAISMAREFGWEVATNDEDMNYYFVKDKTGDESDEFYDDENDRKARADRYRNHCFTDTTPGFWKGDLILAILYIVILAIVTFASYYKQKPVLGLLLACILLGIYFLNSILTNVSSLWFFKLGKQWYSELSMSRAEWEEYKKCSEKVSFSNLEKLRSYLEDKGKSGLSFVEYENGTYHFEADTQQYDYIFDTKRDLKIRLKKEGSPFAEESKDWFGTSLKWYETSIAQAAKYNLKPIAVINKNILVYKRPHCEEPLPWKNNHKQVIGSLPKKGLIIAILIFLGGFFFGYGLMKIIKDILLNTLGGF